MEDNIITRYRRSIEEEENRLRKINEDRVRQFRSAPPPTQAASQPQQAAAAAPSAPPPPQTPQEKPEEQRGYLADMAIGVGMGVRDSAQDFIDAGTALYNFATNSKGDPWQLPNVQTKTLPGSLVRGVTDFLTMFIPFNAAAKVGVKGFKIAQAAEKGRKLARATSFAANKGIVGGAATAAVHNPAEGNLFNMLKEFDNPVLNNAVTQFLAVDDSDGQLEARIKNTFVDAGLGYVAEGIVAGIKYLKAGKALEAGGKGKIKDVFESRVQGDADKLIAEAEGTIATKSDFEPAVSKEDQAFRDKARTDKMNKEIRDLKGMEDSQKIAEKGKLPGEGTLLDEAIYEARKADIEIGGRDPHMRSVPEDWIARDLDEVKDIREFALSQGAESVDEYLQALVEKKNPMLINVVADETDGSLIKVTGGRNTKGKVGMPPDNKVRTALDPEGKGTALDEIGELPKAEPKPVETGSQPGNYTIDEQGRGILDETRGDIPEDRLKLVDDIMSQPKTKFADDPIPRELPISGQTDDAAVDVTSKPKMIRPGVKAKSTPAIKSKVADVTEKESKEIGKVDWGNSNRNSAAKRIVKAVSDGEAQGVILRDDKGKIVGATSFTIEGDAMVGKELIVKSGGKSGDGSFLLNEVIQRAKEMGLRIIKTVPYSPEGKDKELIRFYKRLGFKKEVNPESGVTWYTKKIDDVAKSADASTEMSFKDYVESKGYKWGDGKLVTQYGSSTVDELMAGFHKAKGGITGQGGFANISLMAHMTSGFAGGAVNMYMSEEPSVTDFAVGFVAGGSLSFLGHKLLKLKGEERVKAFSEIKERRLKTLSDVEDKLTGILKRPISQESRDKIAKQLDAMRKMRDEIVNMKNADDIMKHIEANPENSARLREVLKPKIKVKEAELDSFMEKVKQGDFDKLGDSFEINLREINDEHQAESLFEEFNQHFEDTLKKAMSQAPESWDVTRELAEYLGDSMANMNNLYSHTKGLAHKGLGALIFAKKMTNGLQDMIRVAYEAGDNSAKTLLEIRKQASIVAAINGQIKNYPSEVGRALNSVKLLKQFTTKEMLDIDALEAALNQFGGRSKNAKAMKNFLELKTAAQKNLYATSLAKNPSMSFVMELFYSAMLSNPATWSVNAMSGALTTAAALAESTMKGAMAGHGWHEGGAMWHGLREGWNDAMKLAWQTFKKEEPAFDVLTKVGDSMHAITSDLLDHTPKLSGWLDQVHMKDTVGGALDLMGNLIRGGSRILMSTDVFWKVVNHRMSLHSQAYEQAFKEASQFGLKGKAFTTKVAEYMNEFVSSPSPDMLEKATEFARKQTFTNPLRKDEDWIQGIGSGIQNMTANVPAMRFFVPFVRVATNISSYVVERTPVLNMFTKKFYTTLMHGSVAEKQTMAAQLALGGMVIASAVGLVEQGYITGSGSGKDVSNQRQAGWQPYSLRVGDKYFSYKRVDPIGSWLGIVADYYEVALHSQDDIKLHQYATAMVTSFVNNFLSKQYMQGFSELTRYLTNPEERSEATVGRILSAFVPSGMSAVARIIDPTLRETRELLDYAKARIPGLSKSLPPKRDMFGETTEVNGWSQLTNPFTYSEENPDPTYREVGNLPGISPKAFTQSMRQIDGVELTPEQTDKYIELTGKPLKQELDNLFASDHYQRGTIGGRLDGKDIEGTKQNMVHKAMTMHKMRARFELLKAFPELEGVLMGRKEDVRNIKYAQ